MKVSLEWLKEFVAIRLEPEQLADRLTLAGLEVVGVERIREDTVFDLEITPNRPDCLSVIGVAREVAVFTGSRLRLPGRTRDTRHETRVKRRSNLESRVSSPVIRVEDRRGCTRYVGQLFENVRVGLSPVWMVRRLEAVGLRSINNIVDITNYVLLETGQPLHAFDIDRLQGGTIVVRRAAAGERMVTIDGETRVLTPEVLVIADERQSVAIAGVMGGKGSEVTESTRRVLLESACFDAILVRRTSRYLALRTESSYRFERGVDWEGVATASQRAASLIEELAGGCQVGRPVDVATRRPSRRAIRLRPSRATGYAGVTVSSEKTSRMLASLGVRCVRRGSDLLEVTPPSWRRDLTIEADLLEEIIRLWGYDRITAEMPSGPIVPTLVADGSTWFERRRQLRAWLVAAGLDEAITFHLASRHAHRRFAPDGAEAIAVVNPLSQEQELLRASLLPGLARVAAWNLNRGVESVRLFEIGPVYPQASVSSNGELPGVQSLGVAMAGINPPSWRFGRSKPDLFDLKGLLELMAQRAELDAAAWRLEPSPCAGLLEESACRILVHGRAAGVLGVCHERVLAQLEVRQPIYLMEVRLEGFASSDQPMPRYRPLPKVPVVRRDLAVVVDEQVASGDVARLIETSGAPLLRAVRCFDLYRGAQLATGKKSLAYALELGTGERTLSESEITGCLDHIVEALQRDLHATTRSV